MYLKLKSDKYIFSVTVRDADGINDIWDDVLVQRYKNRPMRNGRVVSVDKKQVQTKSGLLHCLKTYDNIKYEEKGVSSDYKILNFMFLENDKVYVLSFMSSGKYAYSYSTPYEDNIVSTFTIKNISQETSINKNNINDYLIECIKTVNQQLPMQIDECTIVNSMLLVGQSIIIKETVLYGFEEFIDYNMFKQQLINNFLAVMPKSFFDSVSHQNYSFQYHIYNETGQLKKVEKISFEEIRSSITN